MLPKLYYLAAALFVIAGIFNLMQGQSTIGIAAVVLACVMVALAIFKVGAVTDQRGALRRS